MHFGLENDKSTHPHSYIYRLAHCCLSATACYSFLPLSTKRRNNLNDIMNKLLVITVLVTLLGLSAHGLRLPRQAEEGEPEEPVADDAESDEEQGTLEKLTSAVKSYYETSINTATGWLDSIRGLKLEEKAKNAFTDTTTAVSTYSGILQDQVYHILYQE